MDFIVCLPVEISEKIIKQLTVEDLAACSCVSHQWREMLNEDWVWTLHYDRKLVECLRSTPCMPTEPFEIPEHPSLSPICASKLAVMMEKRLWKNWRRYSNMYVKEVKPTVHDTTLEEIDFLTDKLILMLFGKGMEIIDVSVIPTVLVASGKRPNHIPGTRYNFIFRGFPTKAPLDESVKESQIGTLLEIGEQTLVIYNVDPIEKSISSRQMISLRNLKAHCVTGDYYIALTSSSLKLLDLNTERKIKVRLPQAPTQNLRIVDYKLIKSVSNDFVVVCLMGTGTGRVRNDLKIIYFIFSLEKLVFLKRSTFQSRWNWREPEVNIVHFRQYLAFVDQNMLKIIDILTLKTLLIRTRTSSDGLPLVFNDAFVFLDHENEGTWLRMFNPEKGLSTNLYKFEDSRFTERYRVIKINERLLGLFYISSLHFEILWEISGQSVKKSNTDTEYLSKCLLSGAKINQSFTKVLFKEDKNDMFSGYSSSSFRGHCLSSSALDIIPPRRRLPFRNLSDTYSKWCVRSFW